MSRVAGFLLAGQLLAGNFKSQMVEPDDLVAMGFYVIFGGSVLTRSSLTED